jgi:hypothetical protein
MHSGFLILALLMACVVGAYCQSNVGSLVGTVTDSSRAAIPGAKITVTNPRTQVTFSTIASPLGEFVAPQLLPGTYNVRAEAPNFETQVQEGVVIDVGQTATVTLKLKLGSTSEQVLVQSDSVGLDTQTPALATTIPESFVRELPLTNNNSQGGNRDVLDLQFLTPGTAGNSYAGTVAGGQEFSGEILMDGSSMDSMGGNSSDVSNEVPSIESVQEFTVMTTGLSPEYGRTENGIINLVTKSGTNAFHGAAYDIIRNTAFDANTWFNNFYSSQNCGGANDTAACRASYATPADKKNDFGINLGGPLSIPKIYNGKDKTFFFFNWEQVRFTTGGLGVSTLPTTANRTGDFSANLVPSNVLLQNNPCDNNNPIVQGEIFDPSTTRTINGVTCRSPFPNNVIPSGNLSTVAQNILQYVPKPNAAGLANNFLRQWAAPVTSTYETIRIDHSLGSTDKIWGSYSTNEFVGYNGSPFLALGTDADVTTLQHFFTHDANAGWDHFFSPTSYNSLTLSFWRFSNILNPLGILANKDWPQVLGISGLNGTPGVSPFPIVSFQQGGYYELGENPSDGQYFNTQGRAALHESLSMVKGKHNLKFGYELRAQQFISWSTGNISGQFNFADAETAGISSLTGQSGNSAASFMLGQMQNASASNIVWLPRYNQYYNAIYGRDDFRVTRDLTLNLGLRWDVDRPYRAAGNNSSMFDPNLSNPGANGLLGALAFASCPSTAGKCGAPSGYSDAWEPTIFSDFGPRLGFAYAPSIFHDKTVISGSYDIIYGPLTNGITNSDQTGFTTYSSYSDSSSIGSFNGTPFTLDQGYPALPTTVDTNPSQLNGQPINATSKDAKPARVQIWDLQVQQVVAPDLVLTLSYVGSHDTRLGSNLLLTNALPEKYWNLGSELTQPVVGNTAGIPVPYPGFTGSIANALRPYPQYLAISQVNQSLGQSSYNALWAKLQRHYRNGLSLLLAYTWSKKLTNAEDWLPLENPAPQNPSDGSQERSLSNIDVPQDFSLSYTYELPFGKGKRFLNTNRALVDALGGWTIGGIQSYASATPISFGCANQIPGTDNCVRWNFVGNNLLSDAERNKKFNPAVDNYFLNPGVTASQVFIDPEAGVAQGAGYQLGKLSRTTSARGFQNIGTSGSLESFSLTKQFFAEERARLDIRAEFLNAFNRHQFLVPDSNPNDLGFGLVSSSQIPPRQLQLTARISF